MPGVGGLTKGQILTGSLLSEPMRVLKEVRKSRWSLRTGCGDPAIGHAHAWLPLRILR